MVRSPLMNPKSSRFVLVRLGLFLLLVHQLRLEELLRVRSHQLGKDFSMKRYFDEVNGAGLIPVTLIQWQLTGSRPQ